MSWLRHATLNSLVGPVADDDPFYYWARKQGTASRPAWEEIGAQEAQSILVATYAAAGDVSQIQAFGFVAPALGAAAATVAYRIGMLSRAGTLVRAAYVAVTTITGQATNYRTLNILNAGASGAGSTNMTAYAFTAGNNAAAGAEQSLGATGTLTGNPGDVIQFQSALTGTGLADPGGFAVVTFTLAG